MQARSALDVINLLKNNDPHQTILSLKGITFDSSEQFTHFCNALVNNTSITRLEFTGCNIDKINKLDPLFIAIAFNKTLKHLNFSEWPIIRTHLDMLSDALSSPCGKSITELNLSNCQITDNNLTNLNFLSYNQSLQKLILSNSNPDHPLKNKINVGGVIELSKQLKHIQHQNRSLFAFEHNKLSGTIRNFHDLNAETTIKARNTTILEIDLKNNPAANSKYYTWDEITSHLEMALNKNRIEVNKRNPSQSIAHNNLNTFSSDLISSSQHVKEQEVLIFIDFYIMKTFSSELTHPKYENAYIFIQENAELFHIIDGEAYKIKINDLETFKILLTDMMGKQTYKPLNKHQIETLINSNNLNPISINNKSIIETTRKMIIDIRDLKLPKNLSHQPHHLLTKSTSPTNSRSTHDNLEPSPSFLDMLHSINTTILTAGIWPLTFICGAGGLGIGCIIATGLLLFGVLATSPIGLAILGAIVSGCILVGAGIGAITGYHSTPLIVLPRSTHATMNTMPPKETARPASFLNDKTTPEKFNYPISKAESVTTFGGSLFLTEDDLRKSKAARERKIAANTLLNSTI